MENKILNENELIILKNIETELNSKKNFYDKFILSLLTSDFSYFSKIEGFKLLSINKVLHYLFERYEVK